MAQSNDNLITHGLRGMIGNQLVFRQRGGKTIISKAPQPSGKPRTAAQQAHHARFRRAAAYAKAALASPALRERYAQRAAPGQNAYNVALADACHPPIIHAVDCSSCTGNPGDTITVHATDDFEVAAVTVRIEAAGGLLVEEGPAIPVPETDRFTYTVTQRLPAVGTAITAIASDHAGNQTHHSCIL